MDWLEETEHMHADQQQERRLQEVAQTLKEHPRCRNAMVMPCGRLKVLKVIDGTKQLEWLLSWNGTLNEAWGWLNSKDPNDDGVGRSTHEEEQLGT